MSSGMTYVVVGIVVALFLSLGLWLREHRTRSALKGIDEFQEALRALAPGRRRRR